MEPHDSTYVSGKPPVETETRVAPHPDIVCSPPPPATLVKWPARAGATA